jgi:membrane-anchored mycosin MYCP
MSRTRSRVARVLAVALLIVLFVRDTPSADAVAPPPIDNKWLPEPALPAPPRPTVQREVCTALTTADPEAINDIPAQLTDLDLPQVWPLTRGAGQRVAVIDTGVSPHRRLPKLVPGGDYVFTGNGTQDCDAHGTVVAGIIAGASDSSADRFSGVAPDATVISIRQSSAKFAPADDRAGIGFGDVDTMAKAVRTAADMGASVINISSVACVAVAAALDDRALGAALAYAVDVKNAVIVAPAGNTGGAAQCPPQRPNANWDNVTVAVSPAWYDDYVLTVGSVNAQGAPSAFTLAGPWVDVAATGEGVTSLSPVGDVLVNAVAGQDGPMPLSGTSYAAPVASGLAALIRARFPALDARQVMQRIESTAHHPPAGWDPLVGNGTIDALAAVSTDPTPQTAGPSTPVEVPVSTVPAPMPKSTPKDHQARNTALAGAAICLVMLVAALPAGAGRVRRGRLWRAGRDPVSGD